MARGGEVVLDWAGEPERLFRLGIGQVRKLQEAVNAGPTAVAARCAVSLGALQAIRDKDLVTLSRMDLTQVAELPHVREVILQGLLGAGVSAPEALVLVRTWVEERPLAESLMTAFEIAMASVLGAEDEPLGEPAGEGTDTSLSPTGNGGSPTSTDREPS